MSISANSGIDPYARTLSLGDAPATQTGAGGQWVNAWSVTGVSAVQKADASNASEAWSALKYTDLLASMLAGGDIYQGDLGVSGQSYASSTVKQEIDGKEALRFNLAEAAQSVTLNLSSFYANDDATGFAEGARIRLFDAGGKLVGESFAQATSLTGNQLVQLNSPVAFRSVEISAGAQRADGSFSFGGYRSNDGSFGSDSYLSGVKHGSDFLVHSISFALARPAAAADSYALDEDAQPAVFASVLANDKDANNAPLTAVLESGASHGTLTFNADGSFSYQPDANYAGQDSFSYRASNGKDLSDVTVVHLTINPVNDAPVAANDHAATNENTIVHGNVLDGSNGGRDTDIDGDTLSVTTAGTFTTALGAAVTLNVNGDFSYDPTVSSTLQALPAGASRVDGFDYTITDGHGGTSTAHVDVTVQGRDDAPTGSGLIPAVAAGTALKYYMHYTGSNQWVQIDSFAVDTKAEASWLKGGGAAGKPQPGAFTLTMGSGKALTDFSEHLLTGTRIDSVEIEAYADTAKGLRLVQEYQLGSAFLNAAQTSADPNGATGNTFGLVYKTLAAAVSPLDAQGRPVTTYFTWNIPEGQVNNGVPLPDGAGADLAHLANTTASDTPLNYFVHIDGINGWIALDSFSLGYSAESSWLKGTGPTVGKPMPSAVTLGGLGLSEVLTTLLAREAKGLGTPTIQVEAYAQHGGAKLVDEYFFNSAFITDLSSGGNASNALSLVYKTFTHSHLEYGPNGQPDKAASSSIGYDVSQAKLIDAPATVAEASAPKAAAPEVAAGTALKYYMHYTGSNQWVQIDGFSVDTKAEASWLKGGGAAGKPQPGTFTLTMGTGKALTDFSEHLLTGTRIESLEIEAYANTASGVRVVQEYQLGDAFLTAARTTTGQDGATSNSYGLVYKTLAESLIPLDAQGKPVTKSFTWNIPEGQVNNGVALPPDGANADLKHLASATPSDVPLNYFVHIDGVNGWIALDSFSLGYSAESSWLKGTGPAVGKPMPSAVTLGGLGLSEVLTTLLAREAKGLGTPTIQVEAYAQHGGAKLVDEYFFNSAFITDLSSGGNASNALSLVYKTFTHSHLEYGPNGQPDKAASSSIGYDVSQAKLIDAPATVAEASAPKAAAPEVAAGTALKYYMHYTGSNQWVQIDGFSVDTKAEASWLKGGGAAGKPQPGTFTLTMGTGKALTDFSEHLLTGTRIESLEIEAYANTASGVRVVQEYQLGDAFLTAARTTTGQDGATSNSYGLVYKTLAESLIPLDAQGKPVTKSFTWNIPEGQVNNGVALPPDGANADLKHLANTTASDVPLDYYVHVDGIKGWVALGSFSLGYSAESSWLKGTGPAVGKPMPSAVTLGGLGLSEVLTTLLAREAKGLSTSTIQVEAYSPHGRLDGGPALVDEYFFTSDFVTDLSSASNADNALSFVYKTYTHSHLEYGPGGQLDHAASSSIGYDVSQAKLIGVPPAEGDVFH